MVKPVSPLNKSHENWDLMWVKPCHKLPIWEWFLYHLFMVFFLPPRKMVMTGRWFVIVLPHLTHIILGLYTVYSIYSII